MKKSTSPSSKLVAAELGVSVATISRALTRPELLSRQTRERVLQGIERLGYRPNLIARDLRRGQTGTVLVVVPKLAPFFLEIFRGAEQAADELGLAVLMGNARGDIEREKTYFDQAASRHADGLILLTGEVPARGPTAMRSLPPLVVAIEPVRDADLPTVGVDHAAGRLKVPEDVSVIGFDDQDFAEVYDPALSTVHIPRFDAGYQAMMMLGTVISQHRAVKSVLLHTRLVIRDTSAPPKRR